MPEGVNGAYKDGVIYVNTKANAAQEIIKHELAHSVEGTKAYNKFAKHVLQTLIDNPELAKNIKGETLEQSITKTSELYQKVLEGKDLTEQQREILTEIVAQYSEKLLTDKTQIQRLVNQDRSIAQKILDWIRDKIAVLKGKTKTERDSIEFLRKAERLYVEALGVDNVNYLEYNVIKGDNNDTSKNIDKSRQFREADNRGIAETGRNGRGNSGKLSDNTILRTMPKTVQFTLHGKGYSSPNISLLKVNSKKFYNSLSEAKRKHPFGAFVNSPRTSEYSYANFLIR